MQIQSNARIIGVVRTCVHGDDVNGDDVETLLFVYFCCLAESM